jgi:MFS family permease
MVLATLVIIPGTRLAERYDLRKTIVAGWVMAIPAPLCFAVAPHWSFTAVGILFNMVSVINTPAINVYLTLGVPRQRIAPVMTTVFSAYSMGLILSNVVTGWLAQFLPLRVLFAIALVFFCAAAASVALLPRKLRLVEALGTARYRDLLAFRNYVGLLALFTVVTMLIFIPWAFTALYAHEVAGTGDMGVGTLMATLYLGSVFIGITLGRLRRRMGGLAVVVCFEIAFLLSAFMLLESRSFSLLALAFFVRGGFWSFRQVMTAVIGEVVPTQAIAKGYGLFALITGAGAALAYPIGGWLYSLDPGAPFWSSAALMGIALIATLLLRSFFGPITTRERSPLELPEAA